MNCLWILLLLCCSRCSQSTTSCGQGQSCRLQREAEREDRVIGRERIREYRRESEREVKPECEEEIRPEVKFPHISRRNDTCGCEE